MKKNLSYLALALLASGAAYAAPLTPDQALERVKASGDLPLATRAISNPVLKKTFNKIDGKAALYVFDNNNDSGFMVVSADDSAAPLLGYTDSGSFSEDNMPPAFKYWLGEYSRQIEFAAVKNGATRADASRVALPQWEAINPLVTTIWNQGTPFNNLCPEVYIPAYDETYQTYTGCVATAMAQVMNYFKYPEKGTGSITYKCASINKTLTMNFEETTFDWDNMLDSYNGKYTSTQAEAVATLMKAAGYSVQMEYTIYASGAVSGYIPGALVKYFGYDKSAYYVARNMKTYTEIATLVYDNLKNIGPVIYNGESPNGDGHSFICDGFRDGYFHFNWGWGGSSNGYFLLDALDPEGIGIGGGGGGYDYRQDLILNIMPDKGSTQPTQDKVVMAGSVKGYAEQGFLGIEIYGNEYPGFRYYGLDEMTFNIGCIIEQANNPSAGSSSFICANNSAYNNSILMPLDAGYILYINGTDGRPYPIFALGRLGLQDNVKYKVTLAYQPQGSSKWYPAECGVGCYNYFYVTKTGSGYKFENFEQMQFECTDLTLDSDLYQGKAVRVNLGLKNPFQTELSRSAHLLLLDKKQNVAFSGDSFALTLQPGETYNQVWTSSLTQEFKGDLKKPTAYYFALYDWDTDQIYYMSDQPVTMDLNPGEADYFHEIVIDNERFSRGKYYVSNAADFQSTVTISVRYGVFSDIIQLYIFDADGRSVGPYYNLPVMLLETKESQSVPVGINFPDATVGDTYSLGLVINGEAPGKDDLVPFVVEGISGLQSSSGIEAVTASDETILFFHHRGTETLSVMGGENGIASIEAFFINGMKAPVKVDYAEGKTSVDLSGLGKGIIIVRATDNAGHCKSIKVSL